MIKVLVVDDNRLMRSLMKEVLEVEGGIRVAAEAGSAGEARECLTGGDIDVVIMDISLKDGVGGLVFLKEVRQQGIRTPFIMVSAHDEDLYARNSLQAQAQGYVCKDKMVACLVPAVRAVCAGETFVSNGHPG